MPDLSVDDLSLKQRDLGRRALFMAQSKVEGVVIDSFYLVSLPRLSAAWQQTLTGQEMIKRYPQFRFLHLAPGRPTEQ